MGRPVSILLADDHALVRSTLADWLQAAPDMTVVATAEDADTAITKATKLKPDVVVLDIDMPGVLAFDAARTIRARCRQTRIMFLSALFHDRHIEQALAAGAMGYLTKGEPPEAVARAIRLVASGAACFSQEVQSRIVIDTDRPRLPSGSRTRLSSLTTREREVLHYLALGMSKKEIAQTMNLSSGTVNNHAANVRKKLDIHDRVGLSRFAIREGLVKA